MKRYIKLTKRDYALFCAWNLGSPRAAQNATSKVINSGPTVYVAPPKGWSGDYRACALLRTCESYRYFLATTIAFLRGRLAKHTEPVSVPTYIITATD